jgi:hypothetical protein
MPLPDDPTPQPGVAETTVDTPDPFSPIGAGAYGGRPSGVDMPVDFIPPWSRTRAPGTVETIAPGVIVPINPWQPGLALLKANQMALLNQEQGARQAQMFYLGDPRVE